MKTALVTGITGQDGSYLAELLLTKNYKVVGLHRRSSTNNFERIKHLVGKDNFLLEEFDLTDPSGINRIVDQYKPQEFYNLGAQSHVGTSFKQPTTTIEINTVGVVNILESIRNLSPSTKFYQASTSEMFGRNFTLGEFGGKYQDEKTLMLPQSPYGVAKLASYHMVEIYRSSYNIFGCSGILFNHESPRRGENFLTRKVTKYIGKLVKGLVKEPLKLGNLDAARDWGHAKDYVRAMYLMLQQDIPSDFVIATGKTRSVKEFVETAFRLANLDYQNHVEIDSDLFRPAEVEFLKGDATKAKNKLGWVPEISFDELVMDMLQYDIKNV
jgi:GDPmannose 4,6-dehydratase